MLLLGRVHLWWSWDRHQGWCERRVDHSQARHNDESLLLWKAVVLLPPPPEAKLGYMLMVPVPGL
jgi:hypothetical protein